ncbi:hypothetical protein BDV93DRAFT_514766 [Ceratobasidium sp. AG-I]|nr:hypothetical protein BDV93DRAFT_514766 [Ceratobasidium sp. AG-I]
MYIMLVWQKPTGGAVVFEPVSGPISAAKPLEAPPGVYPNVHGVPVLPDLPKLNVGIVEENCLVRCYLTCRSLVAGGVTPSWTAVAQWAQSHPGLVTGLACMPTQLKALHDMETWCSSEPDTLVAHILAGQTGDIEESERFQWREMPAIEAEPRLLAKHWKGLLLIPVHLSTQQPFIHAESSTVIRGPTGVQNPVFALSWIPQSISVIETGQILLQVSFDERSSVWEGAIQDEYNQCQSALQPTIVSRGVGATCVMQLAIEHVVGMKAATDKKASSQQDPDETVEVSIGLIQSLRSLDPIPQKTVSQECTHKDAPALGAPTLSRGASPKVAPAAIDCSHTQTENDRQGLLILGEDSKAPKGVKVVPSRSARLQIVPTSVWQSDPDDNGPFDVWKQKLYNPIPE